MTYVNISRKLRIAIAGLGFGKKIHLEALKESDYLIPTAIYHYKKEKGSIIRERNRFKFLP